MPRPALPLLVGTLVACGSGTSAPPGMAGWREAAWATTEVELDELHVRVDVPAALPRNLDYQLGADWWVNAGRDLTDLAAGPRLTLDHPRGDAPADLDAWARRIDLGASDRTVLVSERTADGRLRYAQAWNGNRHLELGEWIPLPDGRGLTCRAAWYTPSERDLPLDRSLVDWLARFCASVHPR